MGLISAPLSRTTAFDRSSDSPFAPSQSGLCSRSFIFTVVANLREFGSLRLAIHHLDTVHGEADNSLKPEAEVGDLTAGPDLLIIMGQRAEEAWNQWTQLNDEIKPRDQSSICEELT